MCIRDRLKGEHPKDWRKSLYYHFYEYPAEHMVKRHYGVRTERYKPVSYTHLWATMGFYTRLNWNYNNIYFLEFSGRYDGSSRFAPGHRWGFFRCV